VLEILEITENIQDSCEELMLPDTSENLTRRNSRSLAAMNEEGSAEGILVWMLKDKADGDGLEAEFIDFKGLDKGVMEKLLDEYGGRTGEDGVDHSFFERSGMSSEDRDVFLAAEFDLEEKEGRDIILDVSELKSMRIKKKRVPDSIKNIGELQELQFMQGITNCVLHGKTGLMDDLAVMPRDWYDPIISSFVMTDGRINGFFLIHRTPSDILMPVLLTAIGPDSRMDLLNMLCYSINAAENACPAGTKILIRRHADYVYSLAASLMPGRKGETVWAGNRMEEVSLF
jgi:hypothetical protein